MSANPDLTQKVTYAKHTIEFIGQLADAGRYVPDIEEETTNGTLKIPYVNGHKPLQKPLNTPFNRDLKIPTYHLAFLFNSLSSG